MFGPHIAHWLLSSDYFWLFLSDLHWFISPDPNNTLGDYDVIGLNITQKKIFIIECKVLQPIGSVFEHSNQQKHFFTKEKYDEKFQKRIDYFSKVATSFFANHGYDAEGFTIQPYMVVNKVFSSYYKHVQFPIVTFGELKMELGLH